MLVNFYSRILWECMLGLVNSLFQSQILIVAQFLYGLIFHATLIRKIYEWNFVGMQSWFNYLCITIIDTYGSSFSLGFKFSDTLIRRIYEWNFVGMQSWFN